MTARKDHQAYWRRRSRLLYYQAVRALVNDIGRSATSLLDVGSRGCPYLKWYPHIPVRVSLDKETPFTAPGIESVREDFLTWEPTQRFDIVTCLQVLEHVADVETFARKLLAVGQTVIVSVPHRWSGAHNGHLHDPVDNRKLRQWFGRQPNYEFYCNEVLATHNERLIQVYEPHPIKWKSLSDRKKKAAGEWREEDTMPGSWRGLANCARALIHWSERESPYFDPVAMTRYLPLWTGGRRQAPTQVCPGSSDPEPPRALQGSLTGFRQDRKIDETRLRQTRGRQKEPL